MAEYGRLLRRWAWLLVICPLTAAVAAGAISREVPLVYQATATVLVIQAQPVPIDSSQASSNVSSTPDQVAATYAELMTQPVFLNKISSELHLGWSTSELASKIKVTPQGTTTVLVVTVSDTNPRRARSIANTLINDFSAWQVREAQQRLGTQIRDAQSQVTILKGRVSADQAQINSVINGQQNQATLTGQATLNELQQQLTTDSTQLQTAESGLTQLQSEAALASDSVVVVSPASVPSNSVSPSRPLTVLLAGVAGLLLAVGLVLLINYLDQTVKDDEELQRRTGLTPIGHIPFVSASKTRMGELIVLGGPPSASEAYRSLRTNLQFASVDRPVKTIVVTSPGPGEGKSRTAANLAIVLAVAGHTTLLLDANFRHPCVHGFFGRASKHGFSELILNDGHQGEEMIRPVREVPGLSVLAAGVSSPQSLRVARFDLCEGAPPRAGLQIRLRGAGLPIRQRGHGSGIVGFASRRDGPRRRGRAHGFPVAHPREKSTGQRERFSTWGCHQQAVAQGREVRICGVHLSSRMARWLPPTALKVRRPMKKSQLGIDEHRRGEFARTGVVPWSLIV